MRKTELERGTGSLRKTKGEGGTLTETKWERAKDRDGDREGESD